MPLEAEAEAEAAEAEAEAAALKEEGVVRADIAQKENTLSAKLGNQEQENIEH